jgi:hypothetical protein
LPNRAKSVVIAAVMAVSVGSVVRVRKETDHVVEIVVSVVRVALVVIVARVRKETGHREIAVLALLAHKASVETDHRETGVLAPLVHRVSVETDHNVHRASVALAKVESVSLVRVANVQSASRANHVLSSRHLLLPVR